MIRCASLSLPTCGLLLICGTGRARRLRPGEQVPSVTEIAETNGVSRGTARRALDLLKEWGLTEATPGWGTFVKARDAT